MHRLCAGSAQATVCFSSLPTSFKSSFFRLAAPGKQKIGNVPSLHARDTLSFSCIHFKRPERIKYMWCCNPSHLNQMDLLLSERIHCPKCKVAANYNKHGQACKATAAWRAAVERAKHMVDTVAAVEHTRACHVCKGGRCVLVHIILKHEQGLMHLWHTFLPCKHLDFPLRACHINCLVNKHLNCLKTISCIKKKKITLWFLQN